MSAPGGGMLLQNFTPLWHPPISVSWILTGLILVGASNAEALPESIQTLLRHPFGFFTAIVIALGAYDYGCSNVSFALLFLVLVFWAYTRNRQEEFTSSPSGTMDWVTNNKKWYVEKALKESPVAIQEKSVNTYPISS
jgi:hypothetical protein